MVNALINKHFPKGHRLRSIINPNNTTVSYSCTRNLGAVIKGHNRKLIEEGRLAGKEAAKKTCNCQRNDECMAGGNCLPSKVIYEATISGGDEQFCYIGLSKTTLKERIRNHRISFRKANHRDDTTLSTKYWEMMEKGLNPTVSFKIIKNSKSFEPSGKGCQLCIDEIVAIMFYDGKLNLLNKR